MSRVLIHPASYENVTQAVDRAFEAFPLDLKGKRVLIKPNALRASEAREGIVTHPSVLAAVVEKVKGMEPADLVVGDNPGLFNYGANEETFRKTGLMEAAAGHYRNIGNDSVRLPFDSRFMPMVSVSRAVLEADIIISLPKFKTHGLTVITGGIKNCYGYLPGAQKAKLHRAAGSPERFHEVVVEVFKLRPPDLFIMDAVVGMEGNGPASPELREIGLVLASDNAVALDSVMAAMMGLEPERLRFLQLAREAGLGECHLNEIELMGELRPIPAYKIPPLGGEVISQNQAVQELLKARTLVRPHVDPDLCTGCGTCVEQCPVSALSMNGDAPEADPEICIRCFSCQEICPEKAITLK